MHHSPKTFDRRSRVFSHALRGHMIDPNAQMRASSPAGDKKAKADAPSDVLRAALFDCAAGREAGLDVIVQSEGRQLLGVAHRMLRRHDLAEEALQDAMVQIWRKAGQFRPETGSARGWIYAILRNRCLNILRDGKRLSLLSPADLAAVQEARQQIVPVEGWEILAGPTKLRDCLEGLDSPSRQTILLAHVAGYSHGEIAAQQDVPLGTVKSLIRRGLIALKECLS